MKRKSISLKSILAAIIKRYEKATEYEKCEVPVSVAMVLNVPADEHGRYWVEAANCVSFKDLVKIIEIERKLIIEQIKSNNEINGKLNS